MRRRPKPLAEPSLDRADPPAGSDSSPAGRLAARET
jgi:hypothetical protein